MGEARAQAESAMAANAGTNHTMRKRERIVVRRPVRGLSTTEDDLGHRRAQRRVPTCGWRVAEAGHVENGSAPAFKSHIRISPG